MNLNKTVNMKTLNSNQNCSSHKRWNLFKEFIQHHNKNSATADIAA